LGSRELHLIDDRSPTDARVVVTRNMQTMALRPHTMLERTGSDPEVFTVEEGVSSVGFTQSEAAIRDCYDAFLDGLERFASYVETGLTDVTSLRPYIRYWIDDISSPTENADDAAWCAALLTYVSFYRFDGVSNLFDAFGKGIRPSSSTYRSFLERMADQHLASATCSGSEVRLSKTKELRLLLLHSDISTLPVHSSSTNQPHYGEKSAGISVLVPNPV
jgi:hypothetical protein